MDTVLSAIGDFVMVCELFSFDCSLELFELKWVVVCKYKVLLQPGNKGIAVP